MKNLKLFISAFLFLFLFWNCSNPLDTEKVYESPEAMIKTAKKDISLMGMDQFRALLDSNVNIQIVDCRTEYDYILGHFPSAMHIPRGLLEFSGKLSNRRLKTLVFGNEMASGALAVKNLELLKYSDCHLLDFSWFDWQEAYPELVEQGMDESQPAAPENEESSGGGCGG